MVCKWWSKSMTKLKFQNLQNDLNEYTLQGPWSAAQVLIFVLNSLKESELFIKGFLHYKTITSQTGSSEAQVNNFFISWKVYVPFSRYQFFVFLTILWFTKSVATWSELVHEYLLNHNSLSHRTWPVDRHKQG